MNGVYAGREEEEEEEEEEEAKAVNEVDAERDCATPAKSKKGGGVVLYSLTLRLSRGPLTCVGACTAGSVGSSHHAGTKCNSWRRNGEFSRQRHFAGQRGVEGSVCFVVSSNLHTYCVHA